MNEFGCVHELMEAVARGEVSPALAAEKVKRDVAYEVVRISRLCR